MTKQVLPREGRYMSISTIRDCISVRNYIDWHINQEELRAFTKWGNECRVFKFRCQNDIMTFYAYLLNHMGFDGFKIRVKKRVLSKPSNPSRTAHPRFNKHLSPPSKRQG